MENKKIKILYLITGLKTGGAEIALYRLLKGLNSKEYDAVVVSIVPISEIGEKIKKGGFKVLSLNSKFKFDPSIIFRLISVFKKERPYILHCFLFHANFLGRIIGKLFKIPIIISSIHNEIFGGKIREKLLKYTDVLSDVTVVISFKVAEKMIREKIVSKNKLRVIYYGIDLKEFSFQNKDARKKIREELGINEKQLLLISVGRLVEAKGYPFLIKAMYKLKEKYSELTLIILGEGEDRKKIEGQTKNLKLENNVLLLGRKDNVADYLNAADIFVLASLWEGMPIAILEAMACGLPVVATKVSGIPEIIFDKETGLLAEPQNLNDLVKKIDYLLSLPDEKRKEMGEKAKNKIKENFSLNKMVREYENLYENLLSSG